MDVAQYLTDFADQAVVLPLAVLVGSGLLLMGWRRGAAVWTVAVVAVLGAMLVLKLVFEACGHLLPFSAIHSPSGHTAAAEAIYGGALALFLRRTGGATVAVAGAILFAVVIGTTRVMLGAHSLPEVVVGTLVGLAGILALVHLAGPPPTTLRWPRLAGAGLVLVLVFHGVHLRAEPVIDWVALRYFWPLSVCAP